MGYPSSKNVSVSIAVLLFLSIAGLPIAKINAENPAFEARFSVSGMSQSRISYETELTLLLLQKTVDEFGPYTYKKALLEANFNRGRREVASGTHVNMFANPLPVQKFASDRELQIVPIPIMKGLLGYRALVAPQQHVQQLSKIKTYSELQAYQAGQVTGWVDVRIYRDNQLPVTTGPTFVKLFDMLSHGRFNYLPLGVSEVEKTLAKKGRTPEQVGVVPGVVLYYSFPVYFQVSKKYPLLANRLRAGLEKTYVDGSLDALFNKHFSDSVKRLGDQNLRVFYLANITIPKPLQSYPPILVKSKNVILSPILEQDTI